MRMNKARRGFSLIELLVVIAIIAILMALTSAAVIRFRLTAMVNATKTNLSKPRAKLGEQWKTYSDEVRKQSLNETTQSYAACAALARKAYPGAPDSDERVKALYLQLRQNQAFPVDFYDAFWPLDRTPQATASPAALSAYVSRLAELGITPQNESTWKNNVSPAVQSAICVLMILEKGPGGSGATADDLGPTAVGTVSLGNSTTRGVVDAWQKPVLLIRQNTPGQPLLTLQSAGNDGIFNTADDVLVTYP